MGQWIKVAEKKDIPDGEAISVEAGKETVAVFNVGGAYFATSDVCPHAGGPLSDGWVEDQQVVCPWHGWAFDLEPGECSRDDGLCRYPVRTEGEAIEIEVPE
jgi:NAD(P)H-dependent nitrite reductase small subunit